MLLNGRHNLVPSRKQAPTASIRPGCCAGAPKNTHKTDTGRMGRRFEFHPHLVVGLPNDTAIHRLAARMGSYLRPSAVA